MRIVVDFMVRRTFLAVALCLILVLACKDDPIEPGKPPQSTEAELVHLDVVFEDSLYQTKISGTLVSLQELLPYGARLVVIDSIGVSPKAWANFTKGDTLEVNQSPVEILVTAEDSMSQKSFAFTIETEQPDYDKLLFEEYTGRACGTYETIDIGELKVENNVWNAGGLPPGSFSQCVYVYEDENLGIVGWQWEYPNNAYGVNAYPQLIYGWKPWHPPSTTPNLPKKISEVSTLKATYEIDVTRNDGNYNLAFDNWINSAAEITPGNIQFEFMIWEDAHDLLPFGDYLGDVNTSNGVYEFYKGEPDWEPPGSNWTYLAFVRKEFRSAGTVDIDELLVYLVDNGIVSPDSYLASVELGNEVGNSTGKAIVKEFRVEID